MYYFVDTACVAAELIINFIFYNSLFTKKAKNKILILIVYICFGISLLVLSFIESASIVRLIYSVIAFAGIAQLAFNSKIITSIVSSLAFMTIYALSDIIVVVVFSAFNVDLREIVHYGDARAVYIVITHLAFLGVIAGISTINKSKEGIITAQTFVILLPVWLSSLALCGTLFIQTYFSKMVLHPIYIAIALGLMYTNIMVMYFVSRIREQSRQKHDADLTEHHYSMEKEYYEQFFAQKEQIRALWHDISKYMKAMQALVSDSNSSEAEKNFAEAQALVDEIPDVVDVGNRVVSIILNEYMNLARNEGIDLRLDVSVPPELFIPTADLYVMLGNTLDNAIEACSELEDDRRYINLRLKMHNKILHYMVENPYAKEHLLKQRIGVHGYGLKNVERCVEKYGGFVQKTSENERFTVSINLSKIK